MDSQKKQFEDILKKVEALKKTGSVDLSLDEDLSIGVMNLVSLEEHFFFTGSKTNKEEYFNLIDEVRETRKAMLSRLISSHEGETWCISKHLLATTMRLIEVGTKLHADGKKDQARDVYFHAYKMYSLFWALRLKLIDSSKFKKVASEEKPWTLQDIVSKLVDCCDEK